MTDWKPSTAILQLVLGFSIETEKLFSVFYMERGTVKYLMVIGRWILFLIARISAMK